MTIYEFEQQPVDRKMNSVLESFSHACAHELREPIRSASNFTQLLASHSQNQLDQESLNYLYRIRQSMNDMDSLIKEISYYLSIIEQKNYEKMAINTYDIFCSIKDKFKKRMIEHNVHFTIRPLPIILGVRSHIYRLFINLIDNAFKFHSEKPLFIDVFVIEQKEFWEFHIRDNGIGIEPEYHSHIFQMFSRLHEKNRYEGFGIGLTVCKEIVQKYHGKITVQSTLGAGSEFIVALPKLVH